MRSSDGNPAILYKHQGEPQPDKCDTLCNEDFVLAIQTPLQADMMRRSVAYPGGGSGCSSTPLRVQFIHCLFHLQGRAGENPRTRSDRSCSYSSIADHDR